MYGNSGRYGEIGSSQSSGGSSSRTTTISVNFGVEQNVIETNVADALIKDNSIITFINENEELNLQHVSFYAKDIVNGARYTVVGIAPDCASGIYNIKALITEV